MKIFKLSSGASSYMQLDILFSHPEKTHEEFMNDCNSFFVKYGLEYLSSLTVDEMAHASFWTKYVADKMEELGYSKVECLNYEIPRCGQIPVEENHIYYYINEFKDIVGDELFKQAQDHNIKAYEWRENNPLFNHAMNNKNNRF